MEYTIFVVFGYCIYLLVVFRVAKNHSLAHYKRSCICFAYVIAPSAEANNVHSTMPVINISGASQVWTTNLSECTA